MTIADQKYYMSVDGGGSKLSVILFDENNKILGHGYGGAINPRFVSDRIIRRNFEKSINECLQRSYANRIDKLYIAMPGPMDLFAYMLSKKVKLYQYTGMSEGENSLQGGIFSRKGVVALSGTGSGVFYINEKEMAHLGGWGGLFDDEGSGYSIGRAALNAAVKSYEKRAEKTTLPELIVEKWQLISFRDVINQVYSSDDYRGLIASLTNLVVEAAETDEICKQILQQAGLEMARQVNAMYRREGIADDIPLMIAGSVWKENPYMFAAFYKEIAAANDNILIHLPWFEAVVGGAVASIFDQAGTVDTKAISNLKSSFSQFRYRPGENLLQKIKTCCPRVVLEP